MKNGRWRRVGQVEYYASDDQTARAAAGSLVWAEVDEFLSILFSGPTGTVRTRGRAVRFRRVNQEDS